MFDECHRLAFISTQPASSIQKQTFTGSLYRQFFLFKECLSKIFPLFRLRGKWSSKSKRLQHDAVWHDGGCKQAIPASTLQYHSSLQQTDPPFQNSCMTSCSSHHIKASLEHNTSRPWGRVLLRRIIINKQGSMGLYLESSFGWACVRSWWWECFANSLTRECRRLRLMENAVMIFIRHLRE